MKRGVPVILMLLLAFSLSAQALAEQSPVLWKGEVCSDVQYQKSIEAVAILGGRVYAGCSYRQLANASGMVGIYYLGTTAAYSSNGTFLWQNDSGYVVKLYPLPDGSVLVGSMGGFITFDLDGRFAARNLTMNKLYDFQIVGKDVYAVDGDFFLENGSESYVGHLYRGTLVNDTVILNGWTLNFTSLVSRVRVGDGIIYVGAGFPSGYVGPWQFGYVYGVLPNGTLAWTVETGQWVRDMESWGSGVLAGTGNGTSEGRLYMISSDGKVLWERELFYTEDIEVNGDTAYIGGMGSAGGELVALDSSGNVLWNQSFPYRVKVVKYADGVLLVGTGKFESRDENGTTVIYSVGSLYAVDPADGSILGELPNLGYVRSIAVEKGTAVVGTASSAFYAVDVEKLAGNGGEKSICGPAAIVALALLGLLVRRR
ncbi:CGP-CTERM sorting domain-containing protein [Thermococcus aciditolerans]|uniref:PQQ-binding-like beta-propeller repeat protein n=1 Tax=Thermococcus aciditolerans TaxID=2598455 RepID=A0A5C0SMF1_9EURY|nr:CGP-CTERM sorting domain-containing protein [Thermococcus aciditolerans]QEK15595.1 PQQ-binding-like beta-propeller repeat protein [Thermococcus aciditolerans]